MDEELSIINTKTRNEKIKNFLIENKKIIISLITVAIFIILSFYSYQIYQDKHKEKISVLEKILKSSGLNKSFGTSYIT